MKASRGSGAVLVALEGRVEVDEIDGLVSDVAMEDFEVIAVVELVGHAAPNGGSDARKLS